jgi:replicative DNA helicase
MTKNTRTKETVRARMAATGENYLTAHRALFETVKLASPWSQLNEILDGGYRPGLHTIAARPAVGKTLVSQALALHFPGNVLYVTREMFPSEFWQRIERLGGSFGTRHLFENPEKLADLQRRVFVTEGEASRASILDTYLDALREEHQHRQYTAVFFDYLQILGTHSRKDDLDKISYELKKLAVDLNIPVFVVASLNRRLDDTIPPTISDMRESSAVIQDSDTVMVLSMVLSPGLVQGTKTYYNKDFYETELIQQLNLSVEKNRYGQTGLACVKMDELFSE